MVESGRFNAYGIRVKEMQKLIAEAASLLKAQKWEAAAALLQRVLSEQPGNVGVQKTLSALYHRLGRVSQAIPIYEALLEQQPGDSALGFQLATAYYEGGEMAKAEGLLARLSQTGTDSPKIMNLCGALAYEKGDYKKAVSFFERALSLDRGDPSILRNLGCALYELGDKERARQTFEVALKGNPDDLVAHYFLGAEIEQKGAIPIEQVAQVGHMLAIYTLAATKGDFGLRVYPVRIEAVDKDTLTLSAPLDDQAPFAFREGVQLILGVPKEDALYGFRTTVVQRIPGKLPMFKVKKAPAVARVQRRKFARVPVSWQVRMSILRVGSSIPDQPTSGLLSLMAKDISLGGMRLFSAKPISRGSLLSLEMQMPGRAIPSVGEVVRCQKTPGGSHEIGVSFLKLTEKDAERLRQFIYEQRRGVSG